MPSTITSRKFGNFTIETGVPVPDSTRGRQQTGLADALRDMEVGECLIVPSEFKARNVWNAAERLGIKVNSKVTPEGRRVWRIE